MTGHTDSWRKLLESRLGSEPKIWTITGVAGFIGSNILEQLLLGGQAVVGLDNFATGHKRNLEDVRDRVGPALWANFRFVEGDIRDPKVCREAVKGSQIVLHQAALGSVPRSLADPLTTNDVNISGFLNALVAAKEEGVPRFVYAASSSTYGDHSALPKVEDRIGRPLSPYAVTKYVNELYAEVFDRCYGVKSIGLRYFNVFGPRQDPQGAYAAVIPRWTINMMRGDDVVINGDGETSRDFCYVANAVQANILAGLAPLTSTNQVYNVAVGDRTSLRDLFLALVQALARDGIIYEKSPIYKDFREGDVRHSQADIEKARRLLEYDPTHTLLDGLREAVPWYLAAFR